jgi:glycosyltransferase involved in cell wall biosynthesis
VVRVHSEFPFLAGEGVAVQWIKEYAEIAQVYVGANSERFYEDVSTIIPEEKVVYLPNYYIVPPLLEKPAVTSKVFVIGCFGAIRHLKNQLIQAVAAVEFAKRIGGPIEFHINTGRVEGFSSENILKNIRAVFSGTDNILVEHGWLSPDDFNHLLRTMNIGMQVSLSETFNLVAADLVAQNVPVVASKEISWLSGLAQTQENTVENIVDTMMTVWKWRYFISKLNTLGLNTFNNDSATVWKNFLTTF